MFYEDLASIPQAVEPLLSTTHILRETMSDGELISRFLQGEEASFSTLYARYYPRIYRYAITRLHMKQDAEDIVQDVFLRVIEKLSTFRGIDGAFAAWLFRIAQNRIVDLLRRKKRGEEAQRRQGLEVDLNSTPDDEVADVLLSGHLTRLVAALSPARREIIDLRFDAELSIKETAQALGKAQGTVKALQFQAMQELRYQLENCPDDEVARTARRAFPSRLPVAM